MMKIDGKTSRQILSMAQTDISNLTPKQYDYYLEFQNKLKSGTLRPPVKKRSGGVVKGYSKLARPQKFKGVF